MQCVWQGETVPGEHICQELAPAPYTHMDLQHIGMAKLFGMQPEICCQRAVLLVRWKQQHAPLSLSSTIEPQKSVVLQQGDRKMQLLHVPLSSPNNREKHKADAAEVLAGDS